MIIWPMANSKVIVNVSMPSAASSSNISNKFPPTGEKDSCFKSRPQRLYVLAGAHSKQLLSADMKKQAVVAPYIKLNIIKSTSDYDTISRSTTDGELSALFLVFSDDGRFSLHPIYTVYDYWENMSSLIVQTYGQHALAASDSVSTEINAKNLWQKKS